MDRGVTSIKGDRGVTHHQRTGVSPATRGIWVSPAIMGTGTGVSPTTTRQKCHLPPGDRTGLSPSPRVSGDKGTHLRGQGQDCHPPPGDRTGVSPSTRGQGQECHPPPRGQDRIVTCCPAPRPPGHCQDPAGPSAAPAPPSRAPSAALCWPPRPAGIPGIILGEISAKNPKNSPQN